MKVNTMGLALTTEQIHTHPLHSVVQRSFGIARHVDFFLWMQESVTEHLPHDVLIAAWGKFGKHKLHYDVASNIDGVRTQALVQGDSQVDKLMSELHDKWLANKRRWFAVNNFDMSDWCGNPGLLDKLCDMRSIVVYGMMDLRGKDDSIYVFFSKDKKIDVSQIVMEMLMPHVDAVLRRVEWLAMGGGARANGLIQTHQEDFSEREREVLRWIKQGKTNQEIGQILQISPNTVKNHLKRIFTKLDVTTRAQAVSKYGESLVGESPR
jgi:transcriptional regulator EpsA